MCRSSRADLFPVSPAWQRSKSGFDYCCCATCSVSPASVKILECLRHPSLRNPCRVVSNSGSTLEFLSRFSKVNRIAFDWFPAESRIIGPSYSPSIFYHRSASSKATRTSRFCSIIGVEILEIVVPTSQTVPMCLTSWEGWEVLFGCF